MFNLDYALLLTNWEIKLAPNYNRKHAVLTSLHMIVLQSTLSPHLVDKKNNTLVFGSSIINNVFHNVKYSKLSLLELNKRAIVL